MQVTSFRISLFWVEIHLDLLEHEQPEEAPMKFLGRPGNYASEFDDSQYFLRLGTPRPLSSPWTPQTKGQHFWTRYSGGVTNANVRGITAWRKLIPFRAVLPLHITSDLPLSYSLFELFFYPHGVAFAITFTWKKDVSVPLMEAVNSAFALRFDHHMKVLWDEERDGLFEGTQWLEAPETELSLDRFSESSLDIARELAYGKEATQGRRTALNPFSVITILNGEDIDLTQAPESNGQIQKALHALTNWQQVREGAATLSMDENVRLRLGEEAGVADVFYGQRRGRAIWYPSRFLTSDKNILYGLQCYHRNIFFASLQTESLYGLAHAVADRLRVGGELSVYQRELSSRAGGSLGLLFGGHQDTYRSYSPPRHIQDNDWMEDINTLRQNRGMPPLH